MSKCHIVGNRMPPHIYKYSIFKGEFCVYKILCIIDNRRPSEADAGEARCSYSSGPTASHRAV